MKKKTGTKRNFNFLLSLSLILSILFSYLYIPSKPVYAENSRFIGVDDDIEVEENEQVNLLENVSAFNKKDEKLQVSVSNVTSENDETYQYDNSNVITVGKAGTIYHVEYIAKSPTEPKKEYTTSRKITSIQKENTEDNLSKDVPKQKTKSDLDENSSEFNEGAMFTSADMDAMGASVEMEESKISTDNFVLECVNHNSSEDPCKDLSLGHIKNIQGGKLKENAPSIIENRNGGKHSYSNAHVGKVQVYFIGKLYITDNTGTKKEYVYYTTDEKITNKTVYAVLKDDEKISLQYEHGIDYTVDYQFENSSGVVTETGPDNWSLNDVFGDERAFAVSHNQAFNSTVAIPRGYEAEVTVKNKTDNKEIYSYSLGKMMEYERNGDDITLKQDSAESLRLTDNISIKNVTDDLIVTVKYKKISQFKFNAYMWMQTKYAITNGKNRLTVKEINNNGKVEWNNPSPSNSNGTFDIQNHGFTWEFEGITLNGHTYEMDQLEINGEPIKVPMTTLTKPDPDPEKFISETTTLSTGTKVTLKVRSEGGTNGVDGKRHYVLEITDCYEDITFSGANMVGHSHKELALHTLHGVANPEWFGFRSDNQGRKWRPLEQDSLLNRSQSNHYSDPMRFKRSIGYMPPLISFTTKDGDVLQSNGDIYDGTSKFVEYLIRKDTSIKEPIYVKGRDGLDKNDVENVYSDDNFEIVSFNEWKASSDGYFYFRGTKALQDYMKASDGHGVVLVNIDAKPIKCAIDYQSGAGTNTPSDNNIDNMPKYQNGGDNGYNCETNTKALISNNRPIDKTGKFIFDHWELLTVEPTEDGFGKLTDKVKVDDKNNPITYSPGESLHTTEDIFSRLSDCFYYKHDNEDGNRAVLTLRAVWREHGEKEAIPYIVRYYISYMKDGKNVTEMIDERTHTVNEGAMLITDLYQDENKTLSKSIQNILNGENQAGFCARGKWLVDEKNTTMKIDKVSLNNNIANIYLVEADASIHVEKIWENQKEDSVLVQLQRKENDQWINVENGTYELSDEHTWKHTFTAQKYENDDLSKEYTYRVVELDKDGKVVEDNDYALLGDNQYHVKYSQDQSGKWKITNTKQMDLLISKVVAGEMGDKTKAFTFDVLIETENGQALNGTYEYVGSIKEEYKQETTSPHNGKLTFTDGKAEINLSHGQQITINNLPPNSTFTVEEKEANTDGYVTTYNDNSTSSSVKLDKDSEVHVVNTKDAIPSTGITDRNVNVEIILAVVITGILLLVFTIWRTRRGMR